MDYFALGSAWDRPMYRLEPKATKQGSVVLIRADHLKALFAIRALNPPRPNEPAERCNVVLGFPCAKRISDASLSRPVSTLTKR